MGTHSISSKVFFNWSGRSLNFVDFVKSGGPEGCVVETLKYGDEEASKSVDK